MNIKYYPKTEFDLLGLGVAEEDSWSCSNETVRLLRKGDSGDFNADLWGESDIL